MISESTCFKGDLATNSDPNEATIIRVRSICYAGFSLTLYVKNIIKTKYLQSIFLGSSVCDPSQAALYPRFSLSCHQSSSFPRLVLYENILPPLATMHVPLLSEHLMGCNGRKREILFRPEPETTAVIHFVISGGLIWSGRFPGDQAYLPSQEIAGRQMKISLVTYSVPVCR